MYSRVFLLHFSLHGSAVLATRNRTSANRLIHRDLVDIECYTTRSAPASALLEPTSNETAIVIYSQLTLFHLYNLQGITAKQRPTKPRFSKPRATKQRRENQFLQADLRQFGAGWQALCRFLGTGLSCSCLQCHGTLRNSPVNAPQQKASTREKTHGQAME